MRDALGGLDQASCQAAQDATIEQGARYFITLADSKHEGTPSAHWNR